MSDKRKRQNGDSRQIGYEKKCGMDYMSPGDVESGRRQISEDSYFGCDGLSDRGVWLDNGTNNFPVRSENNHGYYDFDFAGHTGSNCESAFDNHSRSYRKSVFNFFKHSNYDQQSDDNVYEVNVELRAIYTRKSSEAKTEWYIDHIGGYFDSYGEKVTTSVVENPSFSSPIEMTTVERSIGYHFPPMLSAPSKGIAFASRAFEKEGNRISIPSNPYISKIRQVVGFMEDVAAITHGRFGPIIFDIVSIISGAVMNNRHEDEPMNPALSAFSHGACRFIYEQCGGEFNFTALNVYGLDNDERWTGNYEKVQLLSENTDRYIDFHYKVNVERKNINIVDSEYWMLKSTSSNKVWEVRDGQLQLGTQNGSTAQQFKFEEQENGELYIRSKAWGDYLHDFIRASNPDWTSQFVRANTSGASSTPSSFSKNKAGADGTYEFYFNHVHQYSIVEDDNMVEGVYNPITPGFPYPEKWILVPVNT